MPCGAVGEAGGGQRRSAPAAVKQRWREEEEDCKTKITSKLGLK